MIRHAALAVLLLAPACAPIADATRAGGSPVALAYAPAYTLAAVDVNVPRSLKVSEADRLYPIADIVWRGEPRGDRHEQVAAIFRDGAGAAARSLASGPEVTARIEVTRFHSLSEKARSFTGGDHDMRFTLTLVETATGRVVHGPRDMHANLEAFGGAAAVAAEQRGEDMRSRIVAHIAGVLRKEMSVATGPLAPVADGPARASATF